MSKRLLVKIAKPYKTLNEISNYKVLYALTREVLGYTGHCIIVREMSGFTDKKIYFTLYGKLDTVTLLAHCGANDGIVINWGDQMRFSDATQTTNAKCAKIVVAGVLNTENGEPALLFDNTDDFYEVTLPYSASQSNVSIIALATPTTTGESDVIVGANPISSGIILVDHATEKARSVTHRTATNGTTGATTASGTSMYSCVVDRTNVKIYLDGVLDATGTDDNTDFTAVTNITIGGNGTGSSLFGGSMQMVGITLADEASNMAETYTELSQRNGIDSDYEDTINVSSSSFATISTGTMPNTMFYGDISGKVSLKKKIGFFVWNNQDVVAVSNLTLLNTDGKYDYLLDENIRNLPIIFEILDINDDDYSNAIQIGEFIVDQFSNKDDDTITAKIVNKIQFVDKNTNHNYFPNTLTYTGNREQPEPLSIGDVYQVPAKWVNDTTNILELTSEPSISNLIDVSDRSDPLTVTTDYVELAMTETTGWGIDLASPNDGTITADFVAEDFNALGSNIFEGFVGRLLVDFGGIPESEIDFTTAAAIDTDLGYAYGVHISSGTNIKAILKNACASHCGFYYQKNNGKIAFDTLEPPVKSATELITSLDLSSGVKVSIDLARGLSDSASSRRNWYVFSYDEIRDISPQTKEEKESFSREFRFNVRASDTITKVLTFDDTYAHARDGDYIQTLLTDEASATGLTSQLSALYSVKRFNYEFDYLTDDVFGKGAIDLNTMIKLTHNRYGLDAGKYLRVVELEIKDVQENELTIKGWG